MTIKTTPKKHYKCIDVTITSSSTTIEDSLRGKEIENFRDELKQALEDTEWLIEELKNKA